MKIELVKHIVDDQTAYKLDGVEYCCDEIKKNKFNILDGELYSETYGKFKHCPFCGELIEVNIVKEVDDTELYNKRCEQSSKMKTIFGKQKCNETLQELIKISDKSINDMLMSDSVGGAK